MTRAVTRRKALFLALVAIAASASACKKRVGLCARCHMKIADEAHEIEIEWADGNKSQYDSVVCAVYGWQNPSLVSPKRMTVHEYYTGEPRDAAGLVFVQGSDVPSTMGDDYVPVDPANVKKFEADHGGHDMRLGEIKLGARQKDST